MRMQPTRTFSIIKVLILIAVIGFGIWGVSQFVYEREYAGPQNKTPTYGSFWDKARTVTWATYTDKIFHFSLRYPSSWRLTKEEPTTGFPTWSFGKPNNVGAKVHIRRGSPRCVSGGAFVVVSFGKEKFPVCDREEGGDLWYVTEFTRGKDIYELSCKYGVLLKNCYDFFFSFDFTP